MYNFVRMNMIVAFIGYSSNMYSGFVRWLAFLAAISAYTALNYRRIDGMDSHSVDVNSNLAPRTVRIIRGQYSLKLKLFLGLIFVSLCLSSLVFFMEAVEHAEAPRLLLANAVTAMASLALGAWLLSGLRSSAR